MPANEPEKQLQHGRVTDERCEDAVTTPSSGPEETSTDAAASPVGIAIGINGRLIDPESQIRGGEDFKEDASGTNYIIIQFTKLPSVEQEKKLRDLQVQFCRNIPPLSWLAKFVPSELSPIRELPFVVYANPYNNKLSLTPGLEAELGPPASPRGFTTTAATRGSPKQDTLHNVFIVLHPRARKPEEIRSHLITEFGIPRERLALEKTALRAQLMADEIRQVSKIDDVYRVEQIPEMVLDNHLSRTAVNLPQAQAAFKALIPNNLNLDGTDEIIVICDSGLDNGVTTEDSSSSSSSSAGTVHPFFAGGRILHLDNRSKDQRKDGEGKVLTRDKCEDFSGHGTHVAGIALGCYGEVPSEPAMRMIGPTRLDGVAPKANLVVQNVFSLPTFDENGGLKSTGTFDWGQAPFSLKDRDPEEDLKIYRFYLDPYFGYPKQITDDVVETEKTSKYKWRARIHSSSWGPVITNGFEVGYDYSAMAVDNIVSNCPDLFVVRSAGNNGDTLLSPFKKDGQILSWAAAKNVITVGACYSDNQFIKHEQDKPKEGEAKKPDTRLYYAYQPFDKGGKPVARNHVAHLSSRGPSVYTLDPIKRVKLPNPHKDIIKPDVVAPGIAIYSAASRASLLVPPASTEFGVAPNHAADQFCAFNSGSSMAAPVVAGCAALLRQALRESEHKIVDPSASLLKALIVNGAVDLSRENGSTVYPGNEERDPLFGSNETNSSPIGPAPDDAQGWGRIDIADSVDHVLNTKYCMFRDIKLPKGKKDGSDDDKRLRPDKTPPDSHPWRVEIPPPPDSKKGQKANIKATLAWTDPMGEGLQNRLALSFVFADERYKDKNVAVDSDGTGDKPLLKRMANNNVQKLEARDIEMPGDGGQVVKLVVTVTAVKINGMVPVEGGEEDETKKGSQAYALVWKIWYSDDNGSSSSGSGGKEEEKKEKEKESNE